MAARFNSDVPYKFEQQTVGWTPRLDGSLLIEHEIIVTQLRICGNLVKQTVYQTVC